VARSVSFRLGHTVIRVADLQQAVRDYAQLGFTVTWGSAPDKARNALVYFGDGTFLELTTLGVREKVGIFALNAIGHPLGKRFRRWVHAQEGLLDYVLEPECELAEAIRILGASGIPTSPPRRFSRIRPDHVTLTWSLSCSPFPLPLMMSRYAPSLPVPAAAQRHPNEASRTRSLTVGTTAWTTTVTAHSKFYGREPEIRSESGRRVATFAVEPALLHLIESDRDGLQELVLDTRARTNGYLDRTLAHGAAIRLGDGSA
jgi:catechol 2,3-dioxygenase-like lactoylglutathione lyase family enzyme